jgi:NADPH:quinone reductase
VPEPGRGEVLIAVAAAGLNRADTLQRRGFYPSPPSAPSYPGLEVSGTIAALGEGVTEFKVGDKVCALLQGGGYAEYCRVDAGQVLPVPGSLDMIHAAALPEALFTVWSNVFQFGRLAPGETLLVHGGSSGIGVAAIQLAAARGHTVYATAGSDDKCRFCESLGARRAIDYKTTDFVAEIGRDTAGRGVDVVLDMVGGSYVARNLQVLATEGRLVMIATQGGAKGEIDVMRIMQQRLFITGSTLRPRSVEFKRAIRDQLLEHVWPLLESGRIQPVVDSVFALAEAGRAHARMESSEHKGKIILAVI